MMKKARPVVECLRSRCIETTFIIIILSLFLVSCASTKKVADGNKTSAKLRSVYVTNTKKVSLLPPAAADGIFEGLQLLNGSFGGTSFNLLSYTQIDKTGINLSLMNDFGTDMGNVFYDGEQVFFDSAYFPKNLPGEYIICDIQNAYYDEAALRENYEKSGLEFEVWNGSGYNQAAGVSETRLIKDGKKLIEEISIIDDTVTIKNFLRGYEYKLTKLEE
jgi:hypothetical protein